MKLLTPCLILAVACVATFVGTQAGQATAPEEFDYDTLRRLPGVYVRVSTPRPHEEAAGLLEKELQEDLETPVAASGIRTLSRVEWEQTPGRPMLLGRVSVLRDTADKPEKVNLVSLVLIEDGKLRRTPPNRKTPVVIYHDDTFGVGSVASIRGALRRLGMQFAAEYRQQNARDE